MKNIAVKWQPFYRCGGGCKNCYIKDGFMNNHHSVSHWTYVSELVSGRTPWPVEIILSVDKVSEYTQPESALFSFIFLARQMYGMDTFLQLAIKDVTTLEIFDRGINLPSYNTLTSLGIDVISVSDLRREDEAGYIASMTACSTVRWNLLANEENAARGDLTAIAKSVDEVHIILEKQPLGEKLGKGAIANLERVFSKVNEDTLDGNTRIITDHCWAKSRESVLNPDVKACSAGIDRVHIWPRGWVTGCPYDSEGRVVRTTLETVSGQIVAELKSAINVPPATLCETWRELVEYHKQKEKPWDGLKEREES